MNIAPTSAELASCPFCGGAANKTTESLDERVGYANLVKITCRSCGASKQEMGDTSKGGYADNSTTEARAITAWNRRAAMQTAEPVKPSGYAYRYPDGYIRFSNGEEINGSRPTESLPYFFAAPDRAPSIAPAYAPKFDEAEFDKMVERGTKVWSQVPNDWLEKKRGNETSTESFCLVPEQHPDFPSLEEFKIMALELDMYRTVYGTKFPEGWENGTAPSIDSAAPSLPSTPEAVAAMFRCHYQAQYTHTPDGAQLDPEDVMYTLTVHDLLSAFDDWQDFADESIDSAADAARWRYWRGWWMHSSEKEGQLPSAVIEALVDLDLDAAMDSAIAALQPEGSDNG